MRWVLDADIRGFFDNMNHEWTLKFVEHRVADRRMLRLIRKWLRAGVSEDGQWSETKVGAPQGAVVSPLLANVYLHYVFDLCAQVSDHDRVQAEGIDARMGETFAWFKDRARDGKPISGAGYFLRDNLEADQHCEQHEDARHEEKQRGFATLSPTETVRKP